MNEWAQVRQTWLATFLDLTAGVPSADTFRRVFAALDPKAFRQGFSAWSQAIADRMPELHIAVDGKTVRGSARRGLPAVHVVRAFVVNNSLVLGQLATDEKSNEITGHPRLAQDPGPARCFGHHRRDGMPARHRPDDCRCQRRLPALRQGQPAQPPRRNRGHFELAPAFLSYLGFLLRADQPGPRARGTSPRLDRDSLEQAGVARHLVEANTIVRVESERQTEAGVSLENRYYLSSRKLTATQAAKAIRVHLATPERVPLEP